MIDRYCRYTECVNAIVNLLNEPMDLPEDSVIDDYVVLSIGLR